METRANHVMIGAFALLVTILAFLFVLWLSKVSVSAHYAYYDLKFTGSVAGLPLGGEVRYNGVKVGTVETIHFAPNEPSVVYVLVKIEDREDFSVRQDSQVSLQFLGITGLSYVQIAGGSGNSPKLPIVRKPTGKVPVIVAKESTIAQLVDAFPQLIGKAQVTFDRLNAILDDKNKDRINLIIANLASGSEEFSGAVKNINKLAVDAGTLVNTDAKTTVQELAKASKSISDAAALSDQILLENRAAINDFTVQGLSQLSTFVVEARKLVATLDRIAQHVESDPAGFVLGSGSYGQEIPVRK